MDEWVLTHSWKMGWSSNGKNEDIWTALIWTALTALKCWSHTIVSCHIAHPLRDAKQINYQNQNLVIYIFPFFDAVWFCRLPADLPTAYSCKIWQTRVYTKLYFSKYFFSTWNIYSHTRKKVMLCYLSWPVKLGRTR